jgi:hypothetical protein
MRYLVQVQKKELIEKNLKASIKKWVISNSRYYIIWFSPKKY